MRRIHNPSNLGRGGLDANLPTLALFPSNNSAQDGKDHDHLALGGENGRLGHVRRTDALQDGEK